MKRFASVESAMAASRTGHSSQSLDAVAVFKGLPSDALAKNSKPLRLAPLRASATRCRIFRFFNRRLLHRHR